MKIEWLKTARTGLRKQTSYSLREFGRSTTLRFREKIDGTLRLLQTFPRMGKIEPELEGKAYEYRSIVVHEHFKLVYRVDEMHDTIYITAFWDVRQEPQRLTQETKE